MYGNGDGILALDERGIALTVETVLAKFPDLQVSVKTEMDCHPLHPLRAGETFRDEHGMATVRIYPRAFGMTSQLIPYVVGHELGHVVLGHLDRNEKSMEMELEAERFAGRVLAEFGEDLEETIRVLARHGADTDSHGELSQRINAIRAGFNEGLAGTASAQPEPAAKPRAPARTKPVVAPSTLEDAFDRMTGAFEDWMTALSSRPPPR